MRIRKDREVGVGATRAELAAVEAVARGEATKAQARAVRALAGRCETSGRCMYDLYGEWVRGHWGLDELGCPMWCFVHDPKGVL